MWYEGMRTSKSITTGSGVFMCETRTPNERLSDATEKGLMVRLRMECVYQQAMCVGVLSIMPARKCAGWKDMCGMLLDSCYSTVVTSCFTRASWEPELVFHYVKNNFFCFLPFVTS
jgi:hypothetical protein